MNFTSLISDKFLE